jgi:hypothetical protein
MVVVGIIGLIMGMGAPTLYRMLHREGFNKAVSDIVELCSTARAQAVLQGQRTTLVFYPHERRCHLEGGAGAVTAAGAPRLSAGPVRVPEDISIEMLDVNLTEYKDAPVARVLFFANGTSDELTLILRSDRGEWRKISLDILTGLASVDSDPYHWR